VTLALPKTALAMRRSERKLLNFSVLESTSSIIFGGTQRTAEF